MKKYALISAVIIMCFVLTSCGAGNVGVSSSAGGTSKASSNVSSQINDKNVSDTFGGLQKYMAEAADFSGDTTKMRADLIGAKDGVKYVFGHNGKNNITAELYSFNLSKLNATAKKVIESVKNNGYFTVMDKNVKAVMSDNGKYMMIYTNSAADDDNKAYDKKVMKLFKEFKNT